MDNGDALALNSIDTRSRRVEDNIDKAIVQQVDLIHIQDATVGLGLQEDEN